MHAKSLRPYADRWISIKNTARPSANTMSARVFDLWAIGSLLTNSDTRHDADKLDVLTELTTEDLSLRQLEDAFGTYAETHAASSIRRAMSTWRQFCLWLVREDLIRNNPLDHIDAPKRTPWRPKPLQPSDLAAVADQPGTPSPTQRNPWTERDEALFALLILGGVRISEAISIQIGDCYLDDDPPRIRITGKGDKTRVVPIPPEAVERITAYLQSRHDRDLGTGPPTPLLLRPNGTPLTRSAADHIIKGWFQRAGRTPPKGALAHSFRHTYATMLIDNGASLPEVQQLLGHADLATTQAYLGVTAQALVETAMSNPARRLLKPKLDQVSAARNAALSRTVEERILNAAAAGNLIKELQHG